MHRQHRVVVTHRPTEQDVARHDRLIVGIHGVERARPRGDATSDAAGARGGANQGTIQILTTEMDVQYSKDRKKGQSKVFRNANT